MQAPHYSHSMDQRRSGCSALTAASNLPLELPKPREPAGSSPPAEKCSLLPSRAPSGTFPIAPAEFCPVLLLPQHQKFPEGQTAESPEQRGCKGSEKDEAHIHPHPSTYLVKRRLKFLHFFSNSFTDLQRHSQ